MKKWLNKITVKFGMELKPIQNSCKLQLYSIYLEIANLAKNWNFFAKSIIDKGKS